MSRSLVLRMVGIALGCCSFAAAAEPPANVGRFAFGEGEVVLVPAAGEEEIASPTNYPLAAGAVVRTRGQSGAELEFAGLRLWLAGDSELAVVQTEASGPTDDAAAAGDSAQAVRPALRFELVHGALVARLDDPVPDYAPQLDAAGASIELRQAGEYRLDSTGEAATLQVRQGLSRVEAGGAVAFLTAGQRVEWADGSVGVPEHVSAPTDDFDAWVAARAAPAAESAPRYVSKEMPGYRELDTYGSWEESADYGPVWSPNWVPAGWVPYRNGEWVWLEPWGWTWIDHAPWGFAPFHFGRWTVIHGRWCWVPGAIGISPVFTPGLVHFFDGGINVVKHPRHKRPHRWSPLAPHEKFVPHFHGSARFADRVNRSHERWQGRGSESGRALPPSVPVISRGGEMTVTEWPGGRPRRGRGAASAPGAPVVASPPSFAPVLPARRELGRSFGRGSGRDSADSRGDSGRDFRRRGGVGGLPASAAPPVGVVMPAPAANPVSIPSRRGEAGGRADRRVFAPTGGNRPAAWPRAPQFPTPATVPSVTVPPVTVPRVTMPPVTAPAFAVPQQSWRTHGTLPPAAVVPAPVTVTPPPSSRGFADHDGGRGGRTSPMRGGGRRF